MSLFYADSSALVKLLREEAESTPLRAYISGADLITSELALTEIPRAVRRAAARDPELPLEPLLTRSGELLEALALCPLGHRLLTAAGAIAEPALRALDAIHIAAALSLDPIEAFLTYDERQAAAARLCGLRTVSPSA